MLKIYFALYPLISNILVFVASSFNVNNFSILKKMTKRQRQLEQITNVLIIIAAVLVIGLVSYNFFYKGQETKSLQNGASFDLPGINLKGEKRTLVLVLDKDCHFCSESASFYQTIVKNGKNNHLKLAAVFSHSTDEGKQYLQKLGVEIDDVFQYRFKTEINGTPTLVLVDGFGKVIDSWEGKLSDKEEESVLQKINY
jgi:thioredoxin-related protein